jgi:hypothetical protein
MRRTRAIGFDDLVHIRIAQTVLPFARLEVACEQAPNMTPSPLN